MKESRSQIVRAEFRLADAKATGNLFRVTVRVALRVPLRVLASAGCGVRSIGSEGPFSCSPGPRPPPVRLLLNFKGPSLQRGAPPIPLSPLSSSLSIAFISLACNQRPSSPPLFRTPSYWPGSQVVGLAISEPHSSIPRSVPSPCNRFPARCSKV